MMNVGEFQCRCRFHRSEEFAQATLVETCSYHARREEDVKRYRWLVENPGLAMLVFAEATNVDTFGIEWKDGKPVREVTSDEYCSYLPKRIDELMNDRAPR